MLKFMLCILLSIIVVSESSALAAEPKTYDLDLGNNITGEMVISRIEVKNTSKKRVNIVETSASCGCLTVKPLKSWIEPQSTTQIEITLNGLGRSGMSFVTACVRTDDKNNPLHLIYVKANFESKDNQLTAVPRSVNMGTMYQGQKSFQVIEITRVNRTSLQDLEVSKPPSWMTIEREYVDDAPLLRLWVSVIANAPVNKYDREIRVWTKGHPEIDYVRVPIVMEVVRSVTATPNMLMVMPGQEEYQIHIRSNGEGKDAPILSKYALTGNGLELVSCKCPKGEDGRIIVRIKRRSGQSEYVKCVLKIWINDEEAPLDVICVSPPSDS